MDNTETPKRSWLKILAIIFTLLLLVGGAGAFYVYHLIWGATIHLNEETIITIPTESDLEEVANILAKADIISNKYAFVLTAQLRKYSTRPGKFSIPISVTNNYNLVRVLRESQLSIKLTFHNFRLKEQLAGYLSRKLEIDSMAFAQLLNDEAFLYKYGYTPETVMALFIPNTYEVYWNCSMEDFFERMVNENKKFWTAERLKKADSLGLTPIEVYTLASIVESESQYKPERPRIAGVYLNRLKKEGWKLEADPTVVFAVGDFTLTRVLNKHLETDSPYNTYMYPGLPPGPIYMASINSIDAVLNAEDHEYMFFCARPPEEGRPMTHAFAKTISQHQRNARSYWRWLRNNN